MKLQLAIGVFGLVLASAVANAQPSVVAQWGAAEALGKNHDFEGCQGTYSQQKTPRMRTAINSLLGHLWTTTLWLPMGFACISRRRWVRSWTLWG